MSRHGHKEIERLKRIAAKMTMNPNIIPKDDKTYSEMCKHTSLRLWLVTNGTWQQCVWATDKEDAIKKVPLTYANAYEIKQERN